MCGRLRVYFAICPSLLAPAVSFVNSSTAGAPPFGGFYFVLRRTIWYTIHMNKSQTGRPNLSRGWICSMPKCIRPVLSKTKGMCSMHWQRYTLGSEKLLREWFDVTFECQCGKVLPYPTSCDKCYKARLRAEKRGTAVVTRRRGRNKSHKQVGYRAIHQRIKLWKGPAKKYDCIDKNSKPHKAQEWALQVEPTHWEDKPGTNGRYQYGFTQKVDDYAPMCCHHHRKYDRDNKYHADNNPNFRKEEETNE